MTVRFAEIELQDVGKRYGEVWAVRDVSLTIVRGEFFTLLGPSGCGKTTILRMIAGFGDPDEGDVLIDGRSVNGVPPWRRDLGLVFQSYALWPHLDVFEHVAFGLRERRVPRNELRARVAATLRMVGLDGLERRRPSQLSGGQQQRVALARTLVLEPRALLLDEPLSNLDAKLRAQMRVELRRLHQELGVTTVYVTHDQDEAMALSTRIAVFDRGHAVQLGTPSEVYQRPANRFVAEFLGAANVLTGTLDPDAGGVRVAPDVVLPAAPDVPPRRSRVLWVARPEALHVTPGGSSRVRGVVTSAVYLGGSWDCHVQVGATTALRVAIPATAAVDAPSVGAVVSLIVAPADVIVLDA
jgi:ABC-type Fe3+/spermidine/putrescine transport system ATPase subunit